MTAILTRPGRAALAAAVKAKTLYIAWGSGNSSWGSDPPDPSVDTSALVAEIGRRVATIKEFVTPNVSGDIETPSGEKFSITSTPTEHLYVRTTFAYGDSPTAMIRETGVFSDVVLNSGLPVGQTYFTPGNLSSPGILMLYERRPEYPRSPATRETLEFVITF